MSERQRHVVIIGGGLAGSFAAARLCMRGQHVTMIDDQHPSSASRVAAGLFNVITGRFGAKSWMADLLLKEIREFFDTPGFETIRPFLHDGAIYRPFKEIEEYNKWLGRSEDPAYRHIVEFQEESILPDLIHNPYGGIMIKPCGWVDTGGLINAIQKHLLDNFDFRFLSLRVDYEQINPAQQKVQLDGIDLEYDQLLFAEGFRMVENPWLKDLAIIPNKGEILLVEGKGWNLPFVLSRKVYVIEVEKDHYVVGSTYANSFEHLNPTTEGRKEIEEHISRAIKKPFKVLDQWAGVRPTTPNRRPRVGKHPYLDNVYILGGFGTKGILLGPYMSRLLVNGMLEDQWEIPEEAQIHFT